MSKRVSQEEFISRAKQIHTDPCYDYSNVVFKNMREKVKIQCQRHGIFEMSPISHTIQKQRCPECAKEIKSRKMAFSTKDFINKAREVHGDLFDYSAVVYKDMHTLVTIVCPKHGIFKQLPTNHLHHKSKCPKCLGRNITTLDFINKAREVHGDLFDYSAVVYKDSTTKIKIICPKHGIFKQSPAAHTNNKCGCPKCNRSKGETIIEKILIENKVKYKRQHVFKDCKRKQPLRFDFYVKDTNIAIEYDGEQHFKYIPRIHKTHAKYEMMRENDQIKNIYCEKNNIKLLRISYKDLQHIPEILKEYIKVAY